MSVGDPSPGTSALEQVTALLEGSLLLSEEGVWFHEGERFTHTNIIELFNRSICWDDASDRFVVRVKSSQATFQIEDTAIFVKRIFDNNSPWVVELSNSTSAPLVPSNLRVGASNQVYLLVAVPICSHGTITCPARLSRSAHQQLLSYTLDQDALKVDGQRIIPALIQRGDYGRTAR